jgi:hypothetical protein
MVVPAASLRVIPKFAAGGSKSGEPCLREIIAGRLGSMRSRRTPRADTQTVGEGREGVPFRSLVRQSSSHRLDTRVAVRACERVCGEGGSGDASDRVSVDSGHVQLDAFEHLHQRDVRAGDATRGLP